MAKPGKEKKSKEVEKNIDIKEKKSSKTAKVKRAKRKKDSNLK
jgi:hypothetical protein